MDRHISSDDEDIDFDFSDEEFSEPDDNDVEREQIDSSDTSDSDSDNSDVELTNTDRYVTQTGKIYISNPPRNSRRLTLRITTEREGLRHEGKITTAREAFGKFFVPEILQSVLTHSNEEAIRRNILPTSETELMAFIGLLIYMGEKRDNTSSISDLWSHIHGRQIYTATMSRSRFQQLLRILRFDDKNTRDERRSQDKFAAIRDIFDTMNKSFPKCFNAGEDTVIDEMLSLFRGRCPFKVFIKEKPGKYGILIRILADCRTKYILCMEPYAGKNENEPRTARKSENVVKRLIQPIDKSGRNVTTDRYYTSVDLAEGLWNNHKLTLVGTLRQNRKHIPKELKELRNRNLYSSKFAFSDPASSSVPVTLLSYIPRDKPKRNLLMLSTKHIDAKIGDPTDPKKRAEINLYYNATKGGVDTIDQMVRNYSTKRSTRRWPLSIFYTMLDMAALNGFIIYKENFPNWNSQKPNQRRLFLRDLSMQLIVPHIEERVKNTEGLQKNIILAMENILGRKIEHENTALERTGGRGRCHICTKECHSKNEKYNKVNKTTIICGSCKRFTCGKHCIKTIMCKTCTENLTDSES